MIDDDTADPAQEECEQEADQLVVIFFHNRCPFRLNLGLIRASKMSAILFCAPKNAKFDRLQDYYTQLLTDVNKKSAPYKLFGVYFCSLKK